MSMRALSGQFASTRTGEPVSCGALKSSATAQPASRKRAKLSYAQSEDKLPDRPQVQQPLVPGLPQLREAEHAGFGASEAGEDSPIQLVPYPYPQQGGGSHRIELSLALPDSCPLQGVLKAELAPSVC